MQIASDQRLTARETDLLNAVTHENARQPGDFFKGQDLVTV
jgi:hypothetical protein